MSSKYDIIKLKVHLSEDHFYTFSRFQLSRMLMFCKIPELPAIKIALDVKRHFVNQDRIDTSQAELERVLQEIMSLYGYGGGHGQLLPVITSFYVEHVPLVVLVCGGCRSGKTTLAQLLASRLNCNAVLNTEILRDVVDVVSPTEEDEGEVAEETEEWGENAIVAAWQRNCQRVRSAVAAELDKAMHEGKVVIVEGAFIDLCLYQDRFRARESATGDDSGGILMGIFLRITSHTAAVAAHWGQHKQCRKGAVAAPVKGTESQMEAGETAAGPTTTGYLPGPEDAVTAHQARSILATFTEDEREELSAVASPQSGAAMVPRSSSADTADNAVIWTVNIGSLESLPAVSDAVHSTIVDKILSALYRRGCLNGHQYEALKSK